MATILDTPSVLSTKLNLFTRQWSTCCQLAEVSCMKLSATAAIRYAEQMVSNTSQLIPF